MEKVDIRELFYKKQCQMLASFNLTSTLTHPVSKGDATEDEWRNWFNDYFPKRYRAEKAFVIDCKGNRSEQMDVVIYDTHFSPTIFQINDEKFIPAESVYAVFEVKQDLTKDHIEYAAKKIESVKSLKRTSAPINTINGFVPGRPAPQIIGGLLTLNSGWKTENRTNIFYICGTSIGIIVIRPDMNNSIPIIDICIDCPICKAAGSAK